MIVKNFERFCIFTQRSKTLNDFRISRKINLSFLSQIKRPCFHQGLIYIVFQNTRYHKPQETLFMQ